ncbi:hypothetical protein DFH11DRAFT_1540206 [Phellopilus nigrolimitatus]|nr:hypothetical protein DFH11DRAFT_1540206 [Phellopilus nigrolimitatus]
MSDVAVTILTDSSIALASQWNAIFISYIQPLFTRLLEGRSGEHFNVSVVTYATADCRPTPLLAKRYFSGPQYVWKELREESSKLGIGRTGSGGKMGMAALEGYAAALESDAKLEMFDLLFKTQQSGKEVLLDKSSENQTASLCHIIHISFGKPDEARHPLWNQMSNLDTLSWKSLPDELRKMVSEACQVWFSVRQEHVIQLSSQSAWSPLSIKRVNETDDADNAGDAKRARVSTPTNAPQTTPTSSSQSNSVPTTVPITLASGVASSSLPPAQPTTAPPQPGPSVALMQTLQRYRGLEANIMADRTELANLISQGRVQDAEKLKAQIVHKTMIGNRIKQFLLSAQKLASNKSAESNKDAVAKSEGDLLQRSFHLRRLQQLPSMKVRILEQRLKHLRIFPNYQHLSLLLFVDDSAHPAGNMLAHISPSVAAQMQKLRMKEGIQGQASMSLAPAQQQHGQLGPMGESSIPSASTSKPPQTQPGPGRGEKVVWAGSFMWNGPSSSIMETEVVVQGKTNIRPDLWPSKLKLVISDHAVSLVPVMRDWIQRHEPVMCHIRQLARTIDAHQNARVFGSLVTQLQAQHVYAIGQWPIPPDGVEKPTLLIFPVGDGNLVGAAFPETGIPEFPRANPPGPSGGNVMANWMSAIQNMSQEEKNKFAAHHRLRQQQQMMMQAQAAATAAASSSGAHPGNPHMPGIPPAGACGHAQQQQQQQQQQRQPGMPGPPNSGGAPFNADLFQSFMQRNNMGGANPK